MFRERDREYWTFAVEVSTVKKFKAYKQGKLDSDPNFRFEDHQCPENIEDEFFKMMVKGRVPQNRQEVVDLVKELEETGLTPPRFSKRVWGVSEKLVIVYVIVVVVVMSLLHNGNFYSILME